jgi:methylenetetrahydrofolate dehydrogenase (NADP+)/methenyltetrahydrofolate cyclohydrolase
MKETIMMMADPLVQRMKTDIAKEVAKLKNEKGIRPRLVALLIGSDPVSKKYVELKRSDCADVGIESLVRDASLLPIEEVRSKVLGLLEELNTDQSVSAVIPQMPFENRISEEEVFSTLSPDKDVDGLTPFRLGKLMRKEYSLQSSLLPCTPKGIILLVQYYGVQIKGADVAIIGRSALVGEPLRKMFQDLDATSTCYHTHSRNVLERIRQADIVVAASGRPPEIYGESGFRLSAGMVKEESAVIGVGVKKDLNSGKMLFDVDTKSLKGHCTFLTPNTGGVGAMTRAVLIQNTVNAAKIQLANR